MREIKFRGKMMTRDEIERAIDWLETGDFEMQVGDTEYTANSSHHPNTARFRDTAISALRQMVMPTDEAVQDAVKWQEAQKESVQTDWERSDADWRMEYGVKETHDERMASFDLAIQALRQMRTEPCWIPVSERLPESGEHVLLCCEIRPSKNRYVCDGFYAKSRSEEVGWSCEGAAEYDEETDEYYLPEGFYEAVKNWDEWSSIVIHDFVTHWMPLPEPPKEG